VLPLAPTNPMDVPFSQISNVQWAAGAMAIAVGAVLMLLGTWRMRLLVFWLIAALSPFTPLDLEMASPRYVYMASIPLAVLVGIVTMNALALFQKPYARIASTGLVIVALAAMSVFGASVTTKRNNDFAVSARAYEVLGTRLKDVLPRVPAGSRIVIHDGDGVWNLFWLWPQVTVQAAYRDPTLQVVSVPPNYPPPGHLQGDINVYYLPGPGSFTLNAPSVSH
jgi:hypothetical protein